MSNDAYKGLMDRVKDVGRLRSIEQLLDWDQETYMPPGGVRARADQAALIAGEAHDRLTAADTRTLLDKATADDDDFVAQTNLRETRRLFRRAASVPTALVKETAHAASLAKEAWAKAREAADVAAFAPHFAKLIELKKRMAEHIGYDDEPYDALMDEFEPGATAREIASLFATLKDATVRLLEQIKACDVKPDTILTRHFPEDKQRRVARRMAEALHFDFSAGRMDVSVHPFCTTIGGPGDVRMTTRYNERFLSSALFGTLHETGHALYEQGLPNGHTFTPMGEAVSLGIHESQSRLWENMVGRSRPFWSCHWDELRAAFPDALRDVTLDEFYGAINRVEPSLIRVEADELTYNLHIVIRFDIERGLFNGSLGVDDVPAAWNEKMQACLGVAPSHDGEGCLQDIHWSMGAFGYFPTYALGNLYAAQFMQQARRDISDLSQRIESGDVRPLLNWLRDRIHRHGRRYRAGELVERVTGAALSIKPFIEYLTEKYRDIYDLKSEA